MPETATSPSALLIVADYLKADPGLQALVGNRVHVRLPASPTWPLVRIQRIGGGGDSPEGWLDRPRIQVEAWANTEWDAERVAREARRALFALKNYQHASGFASGIQEMLGLFSLPDPATDRPRYLFDVELMIHP